MSLFFLLGIEKGWTEPVSSYLPISEYPYEYKLLGRAICIGLVENISLSSVPLTRMQYAKALIEINKNRSREPELADYIFGSLEPEFKDCLEDLGFYKKSHSHELIKPITFLNLKSYIYSGPNRRKLDNADGERLDRSFNTKLEFGSEGRFGKHILYFIEPQWRYSKRETSFRLKRGYINLKINNLIMQVGKDNVWIGPGAHGALLFSNNIEPWWVIKLETENYFTLPWFLKKIGKFKFETFFFLNWRVIEKEHTQRYGE